MKAFPLALGLLGASAPAITGFAPGHASQPSTTKTSFHAPVAVGPEQHQPARASFSATTSLHMSSRTGAGRDFYSMLGVSRSADKSEIKSAYRKLAKKYHPDANPGKDTTSEFQDVNRAYEVLGDEDKRKKYDMFGEAGVGSSAASEGGYGGYGSPFGGAGFSQEVDLGDIFDTFFGGG
eukprot:CAMPEP_0181077336 /NCGR_PEP_ID=MMETSP1071-20121207/897_1 /TAXON_ID=35127 /ORGANISM="Thalassiosira sp., Strain NH16" /LENGTH=178 /DNA_ID=CAMNT_0023158575 /DNA_START=177 /DNA_END=709 /DNA_ORIENTATION=+